MKEDMGDQFYVYLHSRPDGENFYVGKGFKNRAYDLQNNRNIHHKRIVAKVGAENVGITLFECASEDNAFEMEIIIIDVLRKSGHRLCNMTNGGDGVRGYVMTDETKRKLSKAHSGKPLSEDHIKKIAKSNTGQKRSEETKRKISKALTGKKRAHLFTDEARANMSLAAKRRAYSEFRNINISIAKTGLKFSEEHRRNLSISHTGKPWSEARRSAYMEKRNEHK